MEKEKISPYDISTIKTLTQRLKIKIGNKKNQEKINTEEEIKENFIYELLRTIEENKNEVEKNCQYTLKKFLGEAIKNCENINQSETIHIDQKRLIPFLWIFYELFLTKKNEDDFSLVEQIWKYASAILYNFNGLFSQIEVLTSIIKNELPFLMIKNDPVSESQKNFHSNILGTEERLKKKEIEFKEKIYSLDEKIKTIEAYDKEVNKILHNYNFAGLHNGFAKMHEEKSSEKTSNLISMFLLGGASFFLALILALTSYNLTSIEAGIDLKIMTLIPILGIEVLTLYFFRLAYIEYRSTVSQILQIKLRMTLCQFIQSYAKYAKEVGGESLTKFENIVFSGIVPDPQNIPSTFDGVEQISQLIEKIKK